MASKNDKIVLALIGAGGRGSQNILSFKKTCPEVEVKYICEVDEERGGRVIDELGKQQKIKPQRAEDMRRVFDEDRKSVV
jgi:predicted dehydrogenase